MHLALLQSFPCSSGQAHNTHSPFIPIPLDVPSQRPHPHSPSSSPSPLPLPFLTSSIRISYLPLVLPLPLPARLFSPKTTLFSARLATKYEFTKNKETLFSNRLCCRLDSRDKRQTPPVSPQSRSQFIPHLTHHHRPALAHLAAFRVHYRTSTGASSPLLAFPRRQTTSFRLTTFPA